jgi:succinoglycan biosynthesis protein ExoM
MTNAKNSELARPAAERSITLKSELPHISVCICTFKRPALLKRLLETLSVQKTGGMFSYSIVVVDNDQAGSGRESTADFLSVPLKYCVEPKQNIAMARNKAVQNASGDYVAFVDDDEFAPQDWLFTLFTTLSHHDADGVLGPVDPHFEDGAPRWVIEGRFYHRPVHLTGMVLPWSKCRTGNVLLKSALFSGNAEPFRPECLSGEDQDFFRRKIESGKTFIWCHEAPAYESVPAVRWKRGFLVRRALFRGVFAQRNHGLQPVRLLQAIISTPLYAIALPIALIFGQAKFMKCVFKLSYHAGRLLAALGFNPIQQPYVTE